MSKPMDEDKLAKQAKALFDDSVDDLDAATLSKLNQGRQRALAELDNTRPYGQWSRWVPATGVAAAAVVAVVVWQGTPTETEVPAASTMTDFEILLSEDSLDMIEDLEFYSWVGSAELETNGNVG